MTLDDLRRYAVARSLFRPTTLERALDALAFVQADPIRAPARAQDLILRHRVKGYRAGDLERRYAELEVEEDFFVNYGFVTRSLHALMHPRAKGWWMRPIDRRARAILDFVRERGSVHPREVDGHFGHGTVRNFWGGSSSATTHLMDGLHYRGLLRVVRRQDGVRIYATRGDAPLSADAPGRRARLDALVDVVVHQYAPLPGRSLSAVVSRLRYAVPQWRNDIKAALCRARERLSYVAVGGVDWYWPAAEKPEHAMPAAARLLAPFDPVVWDRRRFELFWGWAYRFEAYTPAPKRKLGYYALPLLWRDHVIGWANVSVAKGELRATFGYVRGRPRDTAFRRALEAELDRLREFLGFRP